MRIPLQSDCDKCLAAVQTTPQRDLDRAYADYLLAQLHDHRRMEAEAMVWVSRGETRRAYAILSQAVNS